MAESFGPEVVSVASADKEAAIQKLKTEVKANALSDTIAITAGYNNITAKKLFFVEQKNWSRTGGSSGTPIDPDTYVEGTQRGPLPPGVKMGRVYYDSQEQLPTTRKFIVAFDTPSGKVYAESGPLGPVDWNVVEDRLGKATGRFTSFEDKILGGKVQVEIVEQNNNVYSTFMDA